MPPRKIQNGQSPVSQTYPLINVEASVVRTPVPQQVRHCAQDSLVYWSLAVPVQDGHYAAHMDSLQRFKHNSQATRSRGILCWSTRNPGAQAFAPPLLEPRKKPPGLQNLHDAFPLP